ncbi:MAG: ribonuclease P protein component [Candidatus Eisenbacteria bacterium]|nr:ribonuclease P protein component [Candidatus Eisenbacteria bacterium]
MGGHLSPQSVKRESTIKDRGTLERTLKHGVVVRTRFFRMCFLTGSGPPKIAFLAGRRVGGAVRRNRAKRVIREAYRTTDIDLSGIETLVFVATPRVVDAHHHDVKHATVDALRRASQTADET